MYLIVSVGEDCCSPFYRQGTPRWEAQRQEGPRRPEDEAEILPFLKTDPLIQFATQSTELLS